ncbi:MAG: ABC transporter ATP-binding protein [Acidobacteriota bacterium]
MLEARGLTKYYSAIPAVYEVSFTVRPGEVLGYLGPNGSGKSTTVKMIAGLLDPTHGQVFFDGQNIKTDLPGYKSRFGYVPEEPHVYPYLTGREYLLLIGRMRCLPEKVLGHRIDALLRLFGLQSDRHLLMASYSKGMRQKVLICSALLHDPELLIFDEPLSGLDVTTALILRDLVSALARRGKIVLYSSHVLETVEKLCSRVVILKKGRVAADGDVAELRDLMHAPSLEGVFAQLVLQENTARIAADISDAMQLA